MGIATDILDLRQNHLSSVVELLAALDQVREAPVAKMPAKVFLAGEAADKVLTNVAAHAAEALHEPATRRPRRPTSTFRRKNRRLDPSQLSRQRILFA